jgi:hypothetical protein
VARPSRRAAPSGSAYDLRGESGYDAFPQAEDAAAANYASCEGPEGVTLRLEGYRSHHASHHSDVLEERIESESYYWRDLLGMYVSLNLHVLKVEVVEGRLQPGDVLRVTFGDTSGGSPGMQVPGQAKPDWRHWVIVQRASEGEFELLGGDVLVVEPGEAVRLNVVAPSLVTPGEEIPVAHVALDAFGNPVRRVRVQFPAAATEPGEVDLRPGAHFVDRVRLEDERVGLEGQSNPIELVRTPSTVSTGVRSTDTPASPTAASGRPISSTGGAGTPRCWTSAPSPTTTSGSRSMTRRGTGR